MSIAGLVTLCAFFALWATSASAVVDPPFADDEDATTPVSGPLDFRDAPAGTGLTECPQAGLRDKNPHPLDQRVKDDAERVGDTGNDVRANQDYSCQPQDETAIDQNPLNQRNYVGGANDYRLGWGTSGFYATTDNGNTWYDGITPFPSLPTGDNLDGGGDPVTVFDRDGVVYYAQINFNRTDDTSGVWVNRSTNGGFTWTRPCVPIQIAPPPDEQSACGGPGDPRQPGDGTVAYQQDNDTVLNGSVPAYDKEWLTAGPRPAGVTPQCFTPLAHAPRPCAAGVVGSDRLYVSYSLFSSAGSAQIFLSYSDDQARSWSPPKLINGGGAFCSPGGRAANGCDDSQGSEPTVNPTTGQLWVGFINGDTTDEDQYLVVTSVDGGQTFTGPFRVDTLYDVNEPRGVNGRTDCVSRGQGATRAVLTNTCFRADPIFNSIVADKRGGAFADDVYVVLYDNRNGTIRNSNNDIFFYKSTDGGVTWIGPTRVNNDPSTTPANRDCGRNTNSIRGNAANCPAEGTGNDQFFPFISINQKGDLNVTFHDRRLDTTSPVGTGAWPTSKTEQGNYLVWNWGAQCSITSTATVTATDTTVPAAASQCVAPEAVVNPTGVTGINPGAGPVPGNGQNPKTLPFRNFQVSDTPSNFDYTFRAGLFAGDYNGNTTGPKDPTANELGGGQTAALWTDARNGRGSGAPTTPQPGRNPICEQSDVFFDAYSAISGGGAAQGGTNNDSLFWVTPCPTDIQGKTQP
ncbi:MAG: sialidase family protein [Gaiellaceae bacterium]